MTRPRPTATGRGLDALAARLTQMDNELAAEMARTGPGPRFDDIAAQRAHIRQLQARIAAQHDVDIRLRDDREPTIASLASNGGALRRGAA